MQSPALLATLTRDNGVGRLACPPLHRAVERDGMLQEIRERMIAHLSAHRTCVLATARGDAASIIPVHYRNL